LEVILSICYVSLVLEIIENENLVENSRVVGEFSGRITEIRTKFPDHIFCKRKRIDVHLTLKMKAENG
jgi:L-lysine 6-transaminase